jgi:hypothetical protein
LDQTPKEKLKIFILIQYVIKYAKMKSLKELEDVALYTVCKDIIAQYLHMVKQEQVRRTQ